MSFDNGSEPPRWTSDSGARRANGSAVWTDSNFKRYWLVTFRGYSVLQVRVEPKVNVFGEVSYRKRWLLTRTKQPDQ